ncbi:hypothetical protein MLD38_009159 [Melastoma candidum]|uniref:Uncharacterized protein n=1 Tax=Melastoma candidum TaxID=119954 RepID=A0ACB9RWD2_9MYRT|nr:hypothetical protein MLD38_009159 [Melastoma candidum]
MRRNTNPHRLTRSTRDWRWKVPFLACILVTAATMGSAVCGLFGYLSGIYELPPVDPGSASLPGDVEDYIFVESQLERLYGRTSDSYGMGEVPRFAYLISGTKDDGRRIMRTLRAVYHPRNQYILHLDVKASAEERSEVMTFVESDPMFREVKNVRVMQPNSVTYKGPTMIASTLQAVSIMLRESSAWDWFINLSASDYPLVTQDDLLSVFSNVTRNFNFIEHRRLADWKLNQRAKPVVIDPGVYTSEMSDLLFTSQRRSMPTSFKLFTGSAWAMLTRDFLEYCILGWDSLPRTVFMYYTNFISSPEGYYHTVICNSRYYQNTTINHDLHYIAWDNPPKQHPRYLSMTDFDDMVKSNAPFARKFPSEDPILDKIDVEILHRSSHQFVHGGWCRNSSSNDGSDPCSMRGDDSVLRPGAGAERLRELLRKLMSEEFQSKQCL